MSAMRHIADIIFNNRKRRTRPEAALQAGLAGERIEVSGKVLIILEVIEPSSLLVLSHLEC